MKIDVAGVPKASSAENRRGAASPITQGASGPVSPNDRSRRPAVGAPAMPGAGRLGSFSPEILQNVIRRLEVRDVAALMRTSRAMHAMVEPELRASKTRDASTQIWRTRPGFLRIPVELHREISDHLSRADMVRVGLALVPGQHAPGTSRQAASRCHRCGQWRHGTRRADSRARLESRCRWE